MVRLMLTLTPVVCVCGGIVVSEILTTYLDLKRPVLVGGEEPAIATGHVTSSRQRTKSNTPTESVGTHTHKSLRKKNNKIGIFHLISKMAVVLTFAWYLALFVRHSTFVTSTAYSSPSVVLASRLADGSQYIIDDYREAYYWLRMNTPEDARVMSWYPLL